MAVLVAMGYPDETVAAPADEADLLARDLASMFRDLDASG